MVHGFLYIIDVRSAKHVRLGVDCIGKCEGPDRGIPSLSTAVGWGSACRGVLFVPSVCFEMDQWGSEFHFLKMKFLR